MDATDADHRRAAEVATGAGRLLLGLRAELEADGASPETVRAEGDRRSHEFIVAALRDSHPGDPVLSEEAPEEAAPARLTSRRVWVVDPLDGTREFGEPGRTDWAVHVALVIDGVPAAGAVALPALETTVTTEPPPPSHPDPPEGVPPRLVVSRSRAPTEALTLAVGLGATLIKMGSVGAKVIAVVRGDADIYAHAGGQYEWDSAAPAAVAAAAGLHVSRLDGAPLVYNRPDVWLPDILVCRQELVTPALAILAAGANSSGED